MRNCSLEGLEWMLSWTRLHLEAFLMEKIPIGFVSLPGFVVLP